MPGRAIPQPAALPSGATHEQAARGYLSACGSLFGVKDQENELSVKRSKTMGASDRSFVRFQQRHQGIPVFGGEIIVQLDGKQNILSANGELSSGLSLDLQPAIEADVARQTALEAVAKYHKLPLGSLTASQPQLWVYTPSLVGPNDGVSRLVWRTEVTPAELSEVNELVLVDAQRGSIALHFNQVNHAKNRVTYTAGNTKTLPGTLVCDESNPTCSNGDANAQSAHSYAGDAYDFFFNTFGRDGIDGAGMTMISSVHYDSNYCNAFWNGTQMAYGDGCSLIVDDVVAHELSHGVTSYESDFFYYYQSGALSESFSDVFGEFTDLTNGHGTDTDAVRWLLGEDTSQGAIRNMKNPPAFNDPDKMTSPNYNVGTCGDFNSNCDNGGVHTNCGVGNKAAYLMADGDTFNGRTITGLGLDKVARVYYESYNLLTSGSDYSDLANALYQACLNLVGTHGIVAGDCTQVQNATQAVEMDLQPTTGYNPEADLCVADQVPSNLFFDDLENGSSHWTFAAASGSASRWGYATSSHGVLGIFAHSGTKYLYADDYPVAVTDSYAAMNSSVTLPANAYLHFYHAHGFEDAGTTYFDGGVLEYSTNGGSTWTDAGSLIETNGYKGTISTSYGNPLGGRSGFATDSHGYYSTRVNLSSLSGQSVRFRWRMGTDSLGFDMGWWVDDVRIYTCGLPPVAPPVPTGVTASDSTLTDRVQVSWTASTGATSYQVYRNTSDSTSSAAQIGTSTASPYDDTTGTAGLTYWYFVKACNAGLCSDFSASDSGTRAATPSNDDIANAEPIGAVPFNSKIDPTGASSAGTDPALTACSLGSGNNSVWYRYTPSTSRTVFLDTFGSDYDTTIGVFTGSPGSLSAVACNDDDSRSGQNSAVSLDVTSGTTYYIVIYAYNGVTKPTAPAVATHVVDPMNEADRRDACSDTQVKPARYGTAETSALASPSSLRFHITSFYDVPGNHPLWRYVEGFYNAKITSGCAISPLTFCPERAVTRAEMAVFLLRAKHGSTYQPPAAAEPPIFSDTPITGKEWMQAWMEEFHNEGMTNGCAANPLQYCPERETTRSEISVFLLRSTHSSGYQPPAASSPPIFSDTPITGKEWMQAWNEEFYRAGLTAGCAIDPLRFCPERSTTRAEMATFIDRAYSFAQLP